MAGVCVVHLNLLLSVCCQYSPYSPSNTQVLFIPLAVSKEPKRQWGPTQRVSSPQLYGIVYLCHVKSALLRGKHIINTRRTQILHSTAFVFIYSYITNHSYRYTLAVTPSKQPTQDSILFVYFYTSFNQTHRKHRSISATVSQ